MLALVLFAATAVVGGVVFMEALRLRFEDAVPAWMAATVIWLLLWYCLGWLHWGLYLALIITGAAAVRVLMQRRDVTLQGWLRRLVTPQLLVLALALGGVVLLTQGRLVSLWDELRLWAALPKLMYFSGDLQVGQNVDLLPSMQTYIPGMPLWLFFVQAFGPRFVEWRLFFAYAAFGVILLLPITRRLTWRNSWWGVPLCVAALLLIPMYFFNGYLDVGDYYASLYVDPAVGLAAGAAAAVEVRGVSRHRGGRIYLGLLLGLLCSLKDNSVILAVPILGVSILAITLGSGTRAARLQRGVLTATPGVIAIVAWRIVQWAKAAHGNFYVDYGATHYDWSMVAEFWVQLSQEPYSSVAAPWLPMAPIATMFLLLVLAAITGRSSLHLGKRFGKVGASLLIAWVLFEVGLFFLVFGVFNGEFLSFPRYNSALLTMGLAFLTLCMAVSRPRHGTQGSRGGLVGLAVGLTLLAMQFPWRPPESNHPGWRPAAAGEVSTILNEIGRDQQGDQSDVRVTLVFPASFGDPYGMHHQIYFDLIGSPVHVWSWPKIITLDQSSSAGSGRSAAEARARFRSEVMAPVDYIYVVATDPLMISQFADVFVGGVHPQRLYRVEGDRLRPIR